MSGRTKSKNTTQAGQGDSKTLQTQSLTPKQKRVLDFILDFQKRKGVSPSQQEIASHFHFKSLGTVQNYLIRLERHGALQKSWNARRGIQVTQPPPKVHDFILTEPGGSGGRAVPLPILGEVAAGFPIESQSGDQFLDVPGSMLRAPSDYFVLKVRGDSMLEDGILDGDDVVIKKQSTADNGQTVVATIRNEATIKRYYRYGNQIELRPANSAYDPFVIESSSSGSHLKSLEENEGIRIRLIGSESQEIPYDEFRIEGVLAGVIRRFD